MLIRLESKVGKAEGEEEEEEENTYCHGHRWRMKEEEESRWMRRRSKKIEADCVAPWHPRREHLQPNKDIQSHEYNFFFF